MTPHHPTHELPCACQRSDVSIYFGLTVGRGVCVSEMGVLVCHMTVNPPPNCCVLKVNSWI